MALAATPVMGEPVKEGASTDAVIPQQAFIFDKVNAINEVQLTRLAKEGFRPMVMEKLGGYETQVKYVKEPPAPVPYFSIMEEYTTCSYLGDYGAGRTIKTFSLLPGEKTTITVRTYKEKASTMSNAENVLDSFSESSTNELEKLIENETGLSSNSTSESSSSTSKTRKGNVGGNIGASLFGIINIGVSGGYEGGSSKSSTNSSSATRASNIRSINKALDKHISSLSNIKIAFCNGYEESLRVVDLEELDVLLEDTVVPDMIEQVRQTILKHYCTIFNYKDEPIQFVEKVTYDIGECVNAAEVETFWRIRKDIVDTWRADEGGLEIKVKGPILHVSTHTLKTSSAVVDAFLGQGEALDCFNMKAQDAVAIGEQLKNVEALQQLETIQNIDDPLQRAEMYKKVFGTCCDKPQTQIIS